MSNENGNLRLLGSPVNLSYRNKKKDDRKNIRNRPRSALQTFCLTPPENQEKYKRPFSADTKVRAPSTRSLLKSSSTELLQQYNNNTSTTVKIVAPTTDLLGDTNIFENQSSIKDKDNCSNASDHGSEDTFISLGTKIKAKAQLSPKPKSYNNKNFLKYRNISRKGRKAMENNSNEGNKNEYEMEVKITEKPQSPTKNESIFREMMSPIPKVKNASYESYFVPLNDVRDNDLLGRVSFGPNLHSEIEEAIDIYSRRLTVTKQQLSLVEEESIQDVDSVPSQIFSSISPENSLGDKNDNLDEILTGCNTYIMDTKTAEPLNKITHHYMCEPRTYPSFYDDFRSDHHKNKLCSTLHTDSSSKDSGYPDSGAHEGNLHKQSYSLPTTSFVKKSSSQTTSDQQPKSLDSISSNKEVEYLKSYPLDKEQWSEPLNHSRLLYKDFFLRKEGHIALAPQNSPCKSDIFIPGTSEEKNETENIEYPPYLVNSATKAYTSKVIDDYRRELETINNLHELTIRDIKVDSISPTPLNIDKMFEEKTTILEIKKDSDISHDSLVDVKDKNSLDLNKRDISKISTKELIQNYLRVKEGDFKNSMPKNLKRGQKVNNIASRIDEYTAGLKQDWNNKTNKTAAKAIPVNNIRNPVQKNMFTIRRPLSARMEDVNNDKDIDSWMSLSAPSPTILDIEAINNDHNSAEDELNALENKVENREELRNTPSPQVEEHKKPPELNSNATVLDIYSMLKEIESYGDNPVTSSKIAVEVEKNTEETSSTPKDNFMEIFQFLEKVEQSANDALSVVTNNIPQSIPKLEALLKLPQTELAQRLVTASLQLEERSCCIALLQESLANHKEQMVHKVSNLEKQSLRNIGKVKQECEESIKKHQNFIDQLINDKKTLNHRIEQLVDERRSLEERWKRSAQTLEERYKLELKNQHDKMAAAQQVVRQRWVRQKAEKIKELTVKGLEGELREMAERQQKEISDLKMSHAEQTGRVQAKHAQEIEELRRRMDDEREAAIIKERQMASSRLEKQILELELTYQEQRTRLVAEMRAENERVAAELAEKEKKLREELEQWKQEQEKISEEKKLQLERDMAKDKQALGEQLKQKQDELEQQYEKYKKDFEAEQQLVLKRKVTEISAQHKQERDKEIEKAIESMEAEAQAGRKELQEALRRNKEQYEAELKELAETEQATLRRYQDAQARVRQTEDRCAELEVTISQLETRNRVLIEKNNQLESRADEVRVSCEESWSGKVDALKKDIEDLKKTHEEQMHQLYAKVKVAVARKDSAIQALTREAGKYQEKITLLEQKLQQQRKDFLKHK
ncbi:hypothetical protein K1T71_007632 [Dendrolimus kikuchii]|uniref:Uncharacterized protein n=1 Tax=Dendrolimus kikuchii TaxID=765133 RepID=A0ACC1CXT1_9NEOP|nr:hypothetical protein K1T71_007632 [Dendrolimus kikuchii]